MPVKVKWGLDDTSEPDPSAAGFIYDGETPPRGVYRAKLKKMYLKLNKNDEQMLSGVFEINESGDKAEYNGYGIWGNQNVTDQGRPFLMQMLQALGVSWNDFLNKTATVEPLTAKNRSVEVVRLGNAKIADGPECRVVGILETFKGNTDLRAQSYLALDEKTLKEEDDEEDDVTEPVDVDTDDEDSDPPF